jgi:hypothetical protein
LRNETASSYKVLHLKGNNYHNEEKTYSLDKGLIYRIHKELKNGTQKINNLINKGTN